MKNIDLLLKNLEKNPQFAELITAIRKSKKTRDFALLQERIFGTLVTMFTNASDDLLKVMRFLYGSEFFDMARSRRKRIDDFIFRIQSKAPIIPREATKAYKIKFTLYTIGVLNLANEIASIASELAAKPKNFVSLLEKLKDLLTNFENTFGLINILEEIPPLDLLEKLRRYVPEVFADLEVPVSEKVEENIVDILRRLPGAVASPEEILSRLNLRGFRVGKKDLIKKVDSLAKEGIIVGYKKVYDKEVILGPKDIREKDMDAVISAAVTAEYLTIGDLTTRYNWSELRARATLYELEEKGIARYVSSYAEGERWYFPSISMYSV